MKLLHIIATPSGDKSRTLQVSNEFLKSLTAKDPNLVVEELDLFQTKLPDVFGFTPDAKYIIQNGGSLEDQSRLIRDEIVSFSTQFLSYDAYLISSPMWNFSIPYKLKHYIDVIVQVGILFKFTETGIEGLALNKRMFCVTSRGNNYSKESPMHQFDFQEPYLKAVFGLVGIHNISFIHAEPMDFTPDITQASLNKAKEDANLLAENVVV